MKKFIKKLIADYKEAQQRPDEWDEMDYYERKNYTRSVLCGCSFVLNIFLVIFIIIALVCSHSCSTPSHIQTVQAEQMQATIGIPEYEIPQTEVQDTTATNEKDVTLKDDQGKTITLMKAEADENGEMVARDRIIPSVVVARFRNIAERGGKVNIEFEIRVPKDMMDDLWQLRFYPKLDSTNLEPVYITGAKYRESQLKGYERYNRFIASIITDSTRFINLKALELFIQRNIPDLYAFKQDSTIVSEARFTSVFGVTEKEAIDHYTRKLSKSLNARRAARSREMFRQYVPVPIVQEGIRLDTVITAGDEFVYLYSETIPARNGRKKAQVTLSGKIFELNKVIYRIPETEPLTYYISSLTAFVDKSLNSHDPKYQDGVAALQNRDYKRAVTLLQEYKDINTALAYLEMDYNGTARTILETLPDSENVCYLKAIVYARTDRDEEARKYFLKACELKPSLWHRGNLDPEISWLIKHYQLTH